MINEKQIDIDTAGDILNTPSNSSQFDARVVHTVRNLKKLPSRLSEVQDWSKENSDNSNNNNIKKVNSSRDNLAKSINKKIELNKDNFNPRISIDGSGQSTSDSTKFEAISSNLTKNFMSKTVDKKPKAIKAISNPNINSKISVDFAPYKTKSQFQKRLMSENNIIKYKAMCVALLKDDEEMKKLCEVCLMINMNSTSNIFNNQNQQLENFIENNLFNDKFFLYKLETLLVSDVSKQTKEKFFKEEIKKIFEFKVLDIQFENKMQKLNYTIDTHIQNIQNFEFFK